MHRALVPALGALVLASPSIASSHLPGGVDDVSIETSDGVALHGNFFAPRKGRAPAVLLVHDAGANRSQLEDIATSLQRKGFGVLAIDLRGHGESRASKLDWDKLDEEGKAALWQLAPRDIEAAAGWLLSQDDIHSTNLSLVGYRAGCALVARHAERDENVISMTLLAPKPKDFGFDVEQTIQNVNGLPTYVVSPKTDEVDRMVTEANAMTSTPWITLDIVASKRETVLDDRKTASKVSTWLAGVAMPKKGGR